jgi:hypothetical protein
MAGRRPPAGVLSGRASELTRPVSVPVRNVVDTFPRPIWFTAADWMPIAQAATARMMNWAVPAGFDPVSSQPTITPQNNAISRSSVTVMCAGQ